MRSAEDKSTLMHSKITIYQQFLINLPKNSPQKYEYYFVARFIWWALLFMSTYQMCASVWCISMISAQWATTNKGPDLRRSSHGRASSAMLRWFMTLFHLSLCGESILAAQMHRLEFENHPPWKYNSCQLLSGKVAINIRRRRRSFASIRVNMNAPVRTRRSVSFTMHTNANQMFWILIIPGQFMEK